MKNSDYWQKRGELTQNILLQKADSFIDDMERSYKEAYNSIENEINVFFQRFAVNEGLSMNEAKKLLNSNEIEKFKMTVEEYIKKGQENAISNIWRKELEIASNLYRIDRLKSLQIQINQQIEMLSAYKNTGTEKTLKDIFEESYYRNIFDVQQFLGYGKAFEILDTKTINSAIIKPWTYDGETFSQRIWKDNNKLKYSLDKILTQGIIRGSQPDKISKAIAKEMNTSLSNARRLVLTESAVFSTKGRDKSYDELNVDEIEFVASLDEKTCTECGGMDGKHYPRNTGEIGKNIPPLHPYCRCTTAPYFDDEFTEGEERFARDEKGNGYYVPSDMSFEEWKTKYVDSRVLTLDEERAIMKYISSESYVLNEKLRKNIPLNEFEKELAENLDNALQKMPYYKGNLVRSVDISDDEGIEEYLSGFIVGENKKFEEFISTTKGVIYNEKAKIRIYIQDSLKGRNISDINVAEQEVLYERDSEFKVINKIYNNGKYYILLEEV